MGGERAKQKQSFRWTFSFPGMCSSWFLVRFVYRRTQVSQRGLSMADQSSWDRRHYLMWEGKGNRTNLCNVTSWDSIHSTRRDAGAHFRMSVCVQCVSYRATGLWISLDGEKECEALSSNQMISHVQLSLCDSLEWLWDMTILETNFELDITRWSWFLWGQGFQTRRMNPKVFFKRQW